VAQPPQRAPAQHPAVAAALRDCRRAFWSVGLFSGVVNVLMLAGPLYMLQIYDRVLASHSVPTLIALSIFLVGAYAFQAVLDLVRSRVVVRAAGLLDRHLGTIVHNAVITIALRTRQAVRRTSRSAISTRSGPSSPARGRSRSSICPGCRYSCSSATCCIPGSGSWRLRAASRSSAPRC
jgi:ABC-type bacteriocin/lantibiotic exporter with double-glycine peptidase domain